MSNEMERVAPNSDFYVQQQQPQRDMHPVQIDDEAINIIKTTIMPGATDAELQFFVAVCKRTGLDPITRQIHAMKRRSKDGNKWIDKWVFQVGIDGFRLQAMRTNEYEGQTPVEWYDAEAGEWVNVWTDPDLPPAAARVGVYRKGFREALVKVAHYTEYVQLVDEYNGDQKTGNKVPNSMWGSKPAGQLAKCAEALALRAAFPAELSGLYTDDEMAQADNEDGASARKNATLTMKPEDRPTEGQLAQLEDLLLVEELNDGQKAQIREQMASPMFSTRKAERLIAKIVAVVKRVREAGGAT